MNMDGKTVLVTGSTDGVGRYVAKRLASEGANVLIHGRDERRAKELIEEIRRDGHAAPIFYQADLSSLAGTRQLADAVTSDQQAARRACQQCRHRIAHAWRGAAGERRRLRAALFRQLSQRLSARLSPASTYQ